MEKACPLCNGLMDSKVSCYQCSQSLEDWGILENHYDRYGPYMDHNFFNQPPDEEVNSQYYCTHLMYCPNCQDGITKTIRKRLI